MGSKKIVVQILCEILIKFKIEDIVFSPGSRNAPISIQFSNHKKFNSYVIVDERSAGFFALGISQKTQKPTIICCTSGSACVNYYPAIVEAFYQNVPILIITADRPDSYIDIFDGQTIRQKDIFKQHSYASFQLIDDDSNESNLENFTKIKQAISICIEKQGPVHINIPFSEPLYEMSDEKLINIDEFKIPLKKDINIDYPKLKNIWNESKKIMILVGMKQKNESLNKELEKLSKLNNLIILTESTSNLYSENFIQSIDSIIFNFNESQQKDFLPELLITIGQNIVSKKIKNFIRNNKPKYHWHLDEFWFPDTYFCLTEKIQEKAEIFLNNFNNNLEEIHNLFKKKWLDLNQKRILIHNDFLQELYFSDLKAFELIHENIPENINLHISNSTPIRYSQFFNFAKKNINVFCNRGTSGIDGSTSTSVGFASKSDNQTVIITGDLSFFYDINAFWNDYIPKNYRVILINNGGGNIFKIIPGPENTEVLDKNFVAKHNKNAKYLSKHFNLDYFYCDSEQELKNILLTFFKDSENPKILEINTSNQDNSNILRNYMKEFNYKT